MISAISVFWLFLELCIAFLSRITSFQKVIQASDSLNTFSSCLQCLFTWKNDYFLKSGVLYIIHTRWFLTQLNQFKFDMTTSKNDNVRTKGGIAPSCKSLKESHQIPCWRARVFSSPLSGHTHWSDSSQHRSLVYHTMTTTFRLFLLGYFKTMWYVGTWE